MTACGGILRPLSDCMFISVEIDLQRNLATEKMNFYDLRSQMIALEYQNISEIVNFYQALGHQCDLTELCDQINFVALSK